jgi:hypothetical protein
MRVATLKPRLEQNKKDARRRPQREFRALSGR